MKAYGIEAVNPVSRQGGSALNDCQKGRRVGHASHSGEFRAPVATGTKRAARRYLKRLERKRSVLEVQSGIEDMNAAKIEEHAELMADMAYCAEIETEDRWAGLHDYEPLDYLGRTYNDVIAEWD